MGSVWSPGSCRGGPVLGMGGRCVPSVPRMWVLLSALTTPSFGQMCDLYSLHIVQGGSIQAFCISNDSEQFSNGRAANFLKPDKIFCFRKEKESDFCT